MSDTNDQVSYEAENEFAISKMLPIMNFAWIAYIYLDLTVFMSG